MYSIEITFPLQVERKSYPTTDKHIENKKGELGMSGHAFSSNTEGRGRSHKFEAYGMLLT